MGAAEINSSRGRRPLVLLVCWTYGACMLVAALIHFAEIARGGLLPYRWAPMALNVYWTSLAVIDLTAVVLLAMRPRLGVKAVAIVIFTNIAVNAYATIAVYDSALFSHWQTRSQLVFGVYVLATMGYVLKHLDRKGDAMVHSAGEVAARAAETVKQSSTSKGEFAMADHNCETCSFRAKYDNNPGSLLGRLWRWHAGWCPGWKKFMTALPDEKRVEIAEKYEMAKFK